MATTKKTATTGKVTAKTSTPKTTPAAKKTAPAEKPKTTGKAAKKPAAKAATTEKSGPVGTKTAPRKNTAPSAEQRYRMVQEAAYYLAEKDGFRKGALDYWVAAEAEITLILSGK